MVIKKIMELNTSLLIIIIILLLVNLGLQIKIRHHQIETIKFENRKILEGTTDIINKWKIRK